MNACFQTEIAALEPEILQLGDQGDSVRALQQSLRALSIYHQTIDGCFGIETQQAVRQLQILFNLEVTEIFDVATWYALSFWSDTLPFMAPKLRLKPKILTFSKN